MIEKNLLTKRKQLRIWIKDEKKYYFETKYDLRNKIVSFLSNDNERLISKYMRTLRYCEYYFNNSYYVTKNKFKFINDILFIFKMRKKNKLGRMLGIEINLNCFSKGLVIYHAGGIVVNGNAEIGENCILHGNNCIGNNGKDNYAPRLGKNVRVGVGAKVIGKIEIADNVIIGAGAVVVDSVLEKGVTVVGVPAKIVKRENENEN